MNNLKVDLKGLRGGPLEWTTDNHFRTQQYYRVWRWDTAKNAVVRVQDWQAIDVKRLAEHVAQCSSRSTSPSWRRSMR